MEVALGLSFGIIPMITDGANMSGKSPNKGWAAAVGLDAKRLLEASPPTPQKGERWQATGMWEHEIISEVTIISTPDIQDTCVDVRYEDGSERLLPRACFLFRV